MPMMLKYQKRGSEEIPSSSMADVAFLLLIFFIATTIFNKEEGIPLSLPGKSSAVKQMNTKNILKITSDAGGNIFMAEDPIAVHQIADEVERRLAENDKLVIAIESHPDSKYQTMIAILDEVKKAKAPRVSLKMARV